MSAIGTKWAIRPHQRLISPILIGTVCAAVFVLFICAAPARDLGQWEGLDPLHRQWFNGLMRPDRPTLSCCGLADAYWADSYEVKGDHYVAIITDLRDDIPLGRPHIEIGGTGLSSSAMVMRASVMRSIVTCQLGEDSAVGMSAFRGKADMPICTAHVRF
jgi:hypothetical protein